jgi:hypothetical protein
MRNKFFCSLFLGVFLFLGFVFFPKMALAAPRLYLDPSSATVAKNAEFDIKLIIDAEANSIFGSDVVVSFPAADLDIKSVTKGDFFSDFSYAQSSGRLELHGFFSSMYESKSGSGTVATLRFQAKKDSGSGVVGFVCSDSGVDTQILNSDGDNILNCGTLNQSNLTYSATTTDDNNDNDDTTTTTETKACAGGCATNGECSAGLFCYLGFCRNPACQTDADCVCPTAVPTKKASLARPSPTTELVILDEYATPSGEVLTPTPAEEEPKTGKIFNIGNFAIGGLIFLVIALAIFIISKMKKGNKPPESMPPTTNFIKVEPPIPPVQTPMPPTQPIPPVEKEPTAMPPEVPPTPPTPGY